MAETRLLDDQGIGLSVARSDGLDLAHLVPEEIDHALAIARGLLQRRPLASKREQRREGGTVRLERAALLLTRVAVEERRLRRPVEQPERSVLAVDLDEVRAHLGQGRRCRELAAETRGAATVA
jgi:hypothetical protein